MSDSPPKTPAEAEREIDRTRAELSRTLDALETKLNARTVSEKGFEMFRENIDQAMNRGIELVRANPIPAALIAAGSIWMMAAGTGAITLVTEDDRVKAASRKVADMAGNAGSRAGELASGITNRALGHVGHPAVDSDVQQSSGWIHQVSDRAQGAMNRAGDGASQMVGRVTGIVDRHPLVVGGVAMAAGALIAALVPLSRFEQELIGDTRDQIWQKAQHAGQEAATRVRDAASLAASRAVDAAADAAAETVREEIREELGSRPRRE